MTFHEICRHILRVTERFVLLDVKGHHLEQEAEGYGLKGEGE